MLEIKKHPFAAMAHWDRLVLEGQPTDWEKVEAADRAIAEREEAKMEGEKEAAERGEEARAAAAKREAETGEAAKRAAERATVKITSP